MDEYLAIDSGGYLCTNNVHALTTAWLDTSLRSQGHVRLNRSARESSVKSVLCNPEH